MIKILKWETKDGNKMTLKNSPITLGIEMLLISCTEEEKKEIRDKLIVETA